MLELKIRLRECLVFICRSQCEQELSAVLTLQSFKLVIDVRFDLTVGNFVCILSIEVTKTRSSETRWSIDALIDVRFMQDRCQPSIAYNVNHRTSRRAYTKW